MPETRVLDSAPLHGSQHSGQASPDQSGDEPAAGASQPPPGDTRARGCPSGLLPPGPGHPHAAPPTPSPRSRPISQTRSFPRERAEPRTFSRLPRGTRLGKADERGRGPGGRVLKGRPGRPRGLPVLAGEGARTCMGSPTLTNILVEGIGSKERHLPLTCQGSAGTPPRYHRRQGRDAGKKPLRARRVADTDSGASAVAKSVPTTPSNRGGG